MMTEKLEKLERRERTNRQNSERTIKQTEKPTTKKKNRNNQKVKIVITLQNHRPLDNTRLTVESIHGTTIIKVRFTLFLPDLYINIIHIK